MTIDLRKLAEPFQPEQIRWRVGPTGKDDDDRVWCLVYPYVTSRAIQRRLDSDVGIDNWKNTQVTVFQVYPDCYAIEVGLSIQVRPGEWITKYGVGNASEHEPQKGAHSSAMKRAALQWGIGGYLDAIPPQYPKTSLKSVTDWNKANLGKEHQYRKFWWQTPTLPAFALPREDEAVKPITEKDVIALKKSWAAKFAVNESCPVKRLDAFKLFVSGTIGTIDVNDPECWTQNSMDTVMKRIKTTTDVSGPSPDVPFG